MTRAGVALMYRLVLAVAAGALSACAPAVPDSGSGVGFGDYSDYNSYRVQREGDLTGQGRPSGPEQVVAPPPQPAPGVRTTAAPPPDDAVPGKQDGDATRVVLANNPRISDEQNFAVVSERESIESDAERLRAQRQAYEVIEPTAVPSRAGNTGPNIVQYAISTTNPVGQKLYRRSILKSDSKYFANCAKYPSADLAQEAFLKAGGPERDKLTLDPDGDGFACDWDPTPFRNVARG